MKRLLRVNKKGKQVFLNGMLRLLCNIWYLFGKLSQNSTMDRQNGGVFRIQLNAFIIIIIDQIKERNYRTNERTNKQTNKRPIQCESFWPKMCAHRNPFKVTKSRSHCASKWKQTITLFISMLNSNDEFIQ